MDKKEYMSGDELYRYLHISKRKMRYLLQNGYIPVIDTGKKTHRYMVKVEDATAFRQQMEQTSDCLFELKGRFNSRKPIPPLLEPTPENCKAFAEYLTELWADLPDALPTRIAASLVGYSFQRVQECVREGLIVGVAIGNVRYCTTAACCTVQTAAQNCISCVEQRSSLKSSTSFAAAIENIWMKKSVHRI